VSQINLLPPEYRQRQTVRRLTGLVSLAGVVVLAAIGFLYFLQTMDLSRARDDLAAQQSVNANLQSQISDLQEFANLQSQLQTEQQLLRTVFTNEVSWSGVLLDVSRVIPANAYLTNLTGQVTAGTPGGTTAGATTTTGLIGNIQFAGSVYQAPTLSTWLTKLEQVKGWVNAWATTATESGPFTKIYSFSSGVDLSADALTQRGKGGQQ